MLSCPTWTDWYQQYRTHRSNSGHRRSWQCVSEPLRGLMVQESLWSVGFILWAQWVFDWQSDSHQCDKNRTSCLFSFKWSLDLKMKMSSCCRCCSFRKPHLLQLKTYNTIFPTVIWDQRGVGAVSSPPPAAGLKHVTSVLCSLKENPPDRRLLSHLSCLKLPTSYSSDICNLLSCSTDELDFILTHRLQLQ